MLIGELAALAAAFAFSITSVCYTLAGRKINALTSIAMSLPISWLLIIAIHRARLGTFFPTQATPERWFLLGASGILAYVVSSYFMLNAYQRIGPRLTMLVASFAPVLGALLAWLFVGQRLPPNAMLGILVVFLGIVWVVVERSPAKTVSAKIGLANVGLARTDVTAPVQRRGLLDAALGTLAQAAAFVFSSQGVAGGFPPFSATLIRILVGMLALWAFLAWQRKLQATATIFHGDRRLFLLLSGAALSGPVLAGSLLLLSLQRIPVGISTTLSHTTAIILIPFGYFLFHERISVRAIIGTFVTLIGVAILFI